MAAPCLLVAISSVLMELPFPFAGPMPAWRASFAWFGLVPLLVALASGAPARRPLRRGFALGYFAGVLWYMGNCYWVRDTMMQYGDMPPLAPELLLLAFSLYLGLYWGLFGLAFAAMESRQSTARALVAAPLLWVAMELAAARITGFPWDQLGCSQVDNPLLTPLATLTGAYGLSFLLVTVNALLAAAFLRPGARFRLAAGGGLLAVLGLLAVGLGVTPPSAQPTQTAVLIQPNLDVAGVGFWSGPGEWQRHMAAFGQLAARPCQPSFAGTPESGHAPTALNCPPAALHPTLVVWPESPAPYFEQDPRLANSLVQLATSSQSNFIVGAEGMDPAPSPDPAQNSGPAADASPREYNSALIFGSAGQRIGRYDKIHLVPFGEYVPFQRLLFFARKLTGKVSRYDRGMEHKTFLIDGHRYGVFICYEAVFADEVRDFARNGAEALVNISDDGWYGDTSAPWQHLNMVRMRAIENRRWIVRATNNGITAAIDPEGRVRQSIPRHAADALAAGYGFRRDVTFYTAHGDVFAWLCALFSLALLARPVRKAQCINELPKITK